MSHETTWNDKYAAELVEANAAQLQHLTEIVFRDSELRNKLRAEYRELTRKAQATVEEAKRRTRNISQQMDESIQLPVPHKGDVLGLLLKKHGISVKELAKESGVPKKRLKQMIAGDYPINDAMGRCLCTQFSTSETYWYTTQKEEEEKTAKKRHDANIIRRKRENAENIREAEAEATDPYDQDLHEKKEENHE